MKRDPISAAIAAERVEYERKLEDRKRRLESELEEIKAEANQEVTAARSKAKADLAAELERIKLAAKTRTTAIKDDAKAAIKKLTTDLRALDACEAKLPGSRTPSEVEVTRLSDGPLSYSNDANHESDSGVEIHRVHAGPLTFDRDGNNVS